MSDDFVMPKRSERDGAVTITMSDDGVGAPALILTAVHFGKEQSMRVSTYNAVRLFAMIAMMVGIKLPRALAKGIKL